MGKKLPGYTIVDSTGKTLAWRATTKKIWERRDAYAARGIVVSVHCTQLHLHEIERLERNEGVLGPVALQMQAQQSP